MFQEKCLQTRDKGWCCHLVGVAVNGGRLPPAREQIERLCRELTLEIHPSQSGSTADTLQRGTINKGIIPQPQQ